MMMIQLKLLEVMVSFDIQDGNKICLLAAPPWVIAEAPWFGKSLPVMLMMMVSVVKMKTLSFSTYFGFSII